MSNPLLYSYFNLLFHTSYDEHLPVVIDERCRRQGGDVFNHFSFAFPRLVSGKHLRLFFFFFSNIFI